MDERWTPKTPFMLLDLGLRGIPQQVNRYCFIANRRRHSQAEKFRLRPMSKQPEPKSPQEVLEQGDVTEHVAGR